MSELRDFLRETLGHDPDDLSLFERALTHASVGKDSYERLEFLGDRVVGLVIARLLYERFEKEPEGKLSRRYNVLVSRETCAEIGRGIGLPAWIRLGKQARDDGANQSDNVVGDAVESLMGALLIDGGLEKLTIKLPAVVTTDLRLNEPRYVTLPNIMKAKKKPLETVKPADLGVDVAPRIKTLKVSEPPKRSAGIKVPDVATLVSKLKNEAKVI